jgi:hypothetical protein
MVHQPTDSIAWQKASGCAESLDTRSTSGTRRGERPSSSFSTPLQIEEQLALEGDDPFARDAELKWPVDDAGGWGRRYGIPPPATYPSGTARRRGRRVSQQKSLRRGCTPAGMFSWWTSRRLSG